jgi:phage tail protein X
MARASVTRQGVMIDRLVFEALQTDAGGTVEAALALNPGLAAGLRRRGHALGLGTAVTLPEPDRRPRVVRQVKLWD